MRRRGFGYDQGTDQNRVRLTRQWTRQLWNTPTWYISDTIMGATVNAECGYATVVYIYNHIGPPGGGCWLAPQGCRGPLKYR